MNKQSLPSTGYTSLFDAIRDIHVEAVGELLKRDQKCVHERDTYQRTPLHFAAFDPSVKGHQILEMLLASGADPNAKDITQDAPLHWTFCKRGPR